jgi:DNA-binding IclR family transcriptional regulator
MTVPAADRTLDIFEIFARERRPLSVSGLAKAANMPLSSCHGLVKTLEARGYLVESKSQGGYYVGRLLGHVTRAIEEFDPLPEWIVPTLGELRDACAETVVLAKLTGTGATYVEVLESARSIRFIVRVGDSRPLHASAVGKALLGALRPEDCAARVAQLPLQKRNPHTLDSRAALLEDLAESRERGWFRTIGEYFEDVSALAAPLVVGDEFYAFAIAGPSARIDPLLEQHVQRLCATASTCRAMLAKATAMPHRRSAASAA